MNTPETQEKDCFNDGLIEKKLTPNITSHFRGLVSLTESLQIQVPTT